MLSEPNRNVQSSARDTDVKLVIWSHGGATKTKQ